MTGAEAAALAEDILAEEGEASGMARAHSLLSSYAVMESAERSVFFHQLCEDFGPRLDAVNDAVAAFRDDPGAGTAAVLHQAAEPRRQELVRRLNQAPGGTASLVRMRRDLLALLNEAPELGAVDTDLSHLLASWFNRGFLVLEDISWSTPAVILEKIIQYEAVHEIRSWDDLRRRIEPADRRCFAFFHPALVDEPLIFVAVALTRDTPDAIGPILDEDREILPANEATTAVFYSISNCQAGLKGVSFGNFLIKQVVEQLLGEYPHLKTFVTLSPIPGYAKWLDGVRGDDGSGLTDADRKQLAHLDAADWSKNSEATTAIKPALTALAASYFMHAKHRSGKPLDAVARFHLGNGARLERINWLADVSAKGLQQSHSLMVNYLYDLRHIEKNHEAYANDSVIAAAPPVRRAARARPNNG